MPPKSKKRIAEQPVEDLDNEIGSPSNRSRLANAGAESEAENHEDDEDMNAGPEEEEDEDTQDNGTDTQSAPPIRRINIEGRPAEAGVIKRIVCENFMCHQKLTVDLHRNVNFIHGANGSGKSAILAAIQICLGANARRTHRARKIQDLVRKEAAGSSQTATAKVRVTLLNGGEDGFKPDLYGDEITVERVISLRGGYNGYRLLSKDMKEISRKKHDLDELLDYLNIQVDNPVAILDQDEAKKFLTGKDSAKLDFFLKATELSRINNSFTATQDRAEELESTKRRLHDSLAAKAELVRSCKKVVVLFEGLKQLEMQKRNFQSAYAWAFYSELNIEYESALSKKEQVKNKIELKQMELTQAEERYSGANDENEERLIREKQQELIHEATAATKLKVDLEKKRKLAQEPIRKAELVLKTLEGKKKAAEHSLKKAQKILKDARDEFIRKSGNAESEEAHRTALLNETEDALTKAKGETDKIKEAVSSAYRDFEEQGPECEQAKLFYDQKAKQRDAVKSKLRELSTSNSDDPGAIFGPKCSQVCKLVEDARRNHKFKGEVIGPIGAFLKIAPGKEKYAELAEVSIGHGTLDRFILTDSQDREVFDNIRKQAKCFRECGIFLVKAVKRYDCPPPPADDIETVASVLLISNDIVFNTLVDNARIDQRALAPSKQVSEERLLELRDGKYTMRGNINECSFLPRGDKWTTRDGAISLSSNDKKASKKIGVDRSEAIQEAQSELQHLEEELQESKKAADAACTRSHELKVQWNRWRDAQRANESDIQKLTSKKENIENEMATTANMSIDTTEMEEDVAAAEEELQQISQEREKLLAEKEKLQPDVDEAKRNLEEVEARNNKILIEMEEVEAELKACLDRQELASNEIASKRNKILKYSQVLQDHQVLVDEKEAEKDKALSAARKLTLQQKHEDEKAEGSTPTQGFSEEELEQVEVRQVDKDSSYYEAKIKRIEAKISKEKERRDLNTEDRQEAIEKWISAREECKAFKDRYHEVGRVLMDTQADLRERQKRWNKLRKHLQVMTDSRFDQILQLNKSSGYLEFDDTELRLVVQKDINDPNSQTKDVKALSGGERSYATISLLLALGESLETPFRVLDEFDVFLDPQARKLAIQTLIHIAKQMEHRQFIFITPQDLSSVKPDDKVKILKLKPPQRNERASGMSQSLIDSHLIQHN